MADIMADNYLEGEDKKTVYKRHVFTALLKTELTPVAVAMYKKYKTKFPEELKQLCSEADKV